MDLDRLLERIARDPQLPTPPAIALRVMQTANREDCSLAELSRLIAHDPSLSAKLLKTVNSAFLALPQKVGGIGHALSLLGLRRVRALVIGLSLPSMQRRSPADAAMNNHWKASITAAMAAYQWSVVQNDPDRDTDMIAALLCDLGALILREVFPEPYGGILAQPVETFVCRQCALEEEVLGVNHAEVGAYLLSRWGLPKDITEAIRHHHRPAVLEGGDPQVAARAYRLHFASLIGRLQIAPQCSSLAGELLQLAKERFHMDAPQLEQFLEPLNQKVREFASLMNVSVGSTQPFAAVLAQAAEQLAQIASETVLENIRVQEEKEESERLRRRSEDELSRLTLQHELILNAAGEGVFGVDRQGRIAFVNPAAARTLGIPVEKLIGQLYCDVLKPALADQTSTIETPTFLDAVLRDGQMRHAEDDCFARGDGSTFPVRWTCAPVCESEVIVGAVVTFRDISEVKQAQEALRRSEEQLRQVQKMEAIGRLAGGMAHDFNNLLTIIGGYSELLLDGILQPNDPGREAVEEIRKAAERAGGLTRQLLAFSRRQVVAPQVLSINDIIRDMSKMLLRLIGEDIQLSSSLAADLALVRIDPGQLEQILLNLAVNARDAMPRGGRLTLETANVTLDETYTRTHPEVKPGPYVMLAVTDTGCGMDAATQVRIFEPFFTTKEVGKGTGLGLATVYGIVKQSGGSIYVYSEVGIGTSFKVYLPCAEVDTCESTQPNAPMVRRGGSETLLVVEDDEAVRALTRTVLSASAYNVIEAMDPDDALRQVEERHEPIDLLLTDVVMPGMSGRMLADRLKDSRPEMKVLYMSGYTDDAVVRHGLLEADIAFLQKPFSPDSLIGKVREVLDQ